jgi:hypothetical protein
MKSPVAIPTELGRILQKEYLGYGIRALGGVAFIGLVVLNGVLASDIVWRHCWLGGAFLVAAMLFPISVFLGFLDEWDFWASKALLLIAWILMGVVTVFATYMPAWGTSAQTWGTEDRLIVVKNGRTNIGRSFFINPFSRGKVVIMDSEVSQEVAWGCATAIKASASFHILPDEQLVLALAAEAGSQAQTRLENAAKVRLSRIYEEMQRREATIYEVTKNEGGSGEKKTLEYRPTDLERGFELEKLPLRLVGPVTLSDAVGLPVKKACSPD